MSNNPSVAVILAGGSGKRLWPLSDEGHPKQFLKLIPGGKSLLQGVAALLGTTTDPDSLFVIASARLTDQVKSHLPELASTNLIVEPSSRNTGPAITWATMEITRRRGLNTIISFHPADHWIEHPGPFNHLLSAARDLARQDESLVLLGAQPHYAATEYGYIEWGEAVATARGIQAHRVNRFIEKPSAEIALELLASRRFSWNSGILVCRAEALLGEIHKYAPECIRQFEEKAEGAFFDLPESSIERSVLEKTSKALVVYGDIGWHDLGDWDAVARLAANGVNLELANHIGANTEGSIIYALNDEELIVTVGIENTMIVRTDKLTLVVKRDQIGELNKILLRLKQT